MKQEPEIGIVVIGRNEGERLLDCLKSVAPLELPIVYVDSASTDGSVESARRLGASCVVLDGSQPLSAAAARNAGASHLSKQWPAVRFVQFVDGDCIIAPDWIQRGLATLRSDAQLAVVCGWRKERYPERSIYNRLCDVEWRGPVGDVHSCGGDSMMRLEAFARVGGFDPTVRAGEEPELCQRLRAAGWRISRIDAEMTAHDMAMSSFGQWWKRQVRGGYGAIDVAARFRHQKYKSQVRSARVWTLGWLGVTALLAALGGLFAGPWGFITGITMGASLLLVQAMRIALIVRRRGFSSEVAGPYGAMAIISKWGQLLGQVRWFQEIAGVRERRLIEYKSVAQSVIR